MDPAPDVPYVPPFPDENRTPTGEPAGTYTLTKEYVQQLSLFLYVLISYLGEQYERCGPVDDN